MGYEIMVLGDMNDFDSEVVDRNGNMPISMVLDILKGGLGEYGGKYQLFNVAEKMSQEDR